MSALTVMCARLSAYCVIICDVDIQWVYSYDVSRDSFEGFYPHSPLKPMRHCTGQFKFNSFADIVNLSGLDRPTLG